MYVTESGRQSVSPARELSDNVSEAGSSGRRVRTIRAKGQSQ